MLLTIQYKSLKIKKKNQNAKFKIVIKNLNMLGNRNI